MALKDYILHGRKIIFKRNAMPEFLTLFATNRCNLKCSHCFHWKSIGSDGAELSLAQIESISNSLPDFTYISITGGEPYLRDDLPQIARTFSVRNNVQNLSVVTNGFLTDKIVSDTKKIINACPGTNIAVVVSIDGIGKDHDDIRGAAGVFDNAIRTIDGLKALKAVYPDFNVGVAITYMAQNQNNIMSIYKFIRDDIKPDSISLTLIRGDARDPVSKKIDIGGYENVCRQMDRDLMAGRVSGLRGFAISDFIAAMKMALWKMTARIYRKNKYSVPCYAGLISGVIRADGDVYPCELFDIKIGNIKEYDCDFRRLWSSAQAEAVRRKIRAKKCFCVHDCNLTCNILFNLPCVLKIAPVAAVLALKRIVARKT
ncbi:MAG: radical SAM protein [Candidatus Omnitrophota bacterium]